MIHLITMIHGFTVKYATKTVMGRGKTFPPSDSMQTRVFDPQGQSSALRLLFERVDGAVDGTARRRDAEVMMECVIQMRIGSKEVKAACVGQSHSEQSTVER